MVYRWYLRFRVLEDCWQGCCLGSRFWCCLIALPMVSLGFIANGLCLLMGLLKLVSAPTTPRSCKAPAEHHDLFTDAALPNQGHMAYGETCLNICKSGVHISSALTQALLFQKKRNKKKIAREKGHFCLRVLSVRLLCSSVSWKHELPLKIKWVLNCFLPIQ